MLQPSTSAKLTSFLACLVTQTVVGAGLAHADDGTEPTAAVAWHATAAGFQRQLSARVGLTWRENPIGNAVAGLARSQQVAMFLDRRVDPNRKIDFSVQDVSLRDALLELANAHGLGVSYVGTVVYLGPPWVTGRLATLIAIRNQQLVSWPVETRRRLSRRQVWRWPRLAEPRKLIEQLAQDAGIEIQGIDQLPHDLWPAADLPPLTFTQRLTLVLAGFDRTFEFLPNQTRVRIVPIPNEIKSDLSRQPASIDAPDGKEKRFTLRIVNQPAEALLDRLVTELSLSLDVDPSASRHVKERITLHVTNVTLDELLSAALQPLGLSHELRGLRLTIGQRVADHQR